MPNPNDPNTDPTNPEPNAPEPNAPEPNDAGAGNHDDQLKDKHGEDAINRGRYEREMKAKDDEIAELKKKLEESGERAKSGEEAMKKVEALERKLADEKLAGALKLEGCVDEKAAKARLGDFDGDVKKLKESCPYLFANPRQTGSTGVRAGGAPDASAELIAKAREAAGTTRYYKAD